MEYDPLTDSRTADMPGTIRIQLARHGGERIDFEMYRSLLAQLGKPSYIRLICDDATDLALIEAVDLASATGAITELASPFTIFSERLIGELAVSRLNRLEIILDLQDRSGFEPQGLTQKLELFMRARDKSGSATPEVTLSVSATRAALLQLKEIAEFANSVGIAQLSVHPVVLHVADQPADTDFRALFQEITMSVPRVFVNVIAAQPAGEAELDAAPRYFAGRLPEDAAILTCEQDPWDSVRILENGDVHTCAVRHAVKIGSVRERPVREIWNGDEYREFRRAYVSGLVDECRECPLKLAYLPTPLTHTIVPGSKNEQLLSGWYPSDPRHIWSEPTSVASLQDVNGSAALRIRGQLPAPFSSASNVLSVDIDGEMLGTVVNITGEQIYFNQGFPFVGLGRRVRILTFRVSDVYRPIDAGRGGDKRQLGFALEHLEIALT